MATAEQNETDTDRSVWRLSSPPEEYLSGRRHDGSFFIMRAESETAFRRRYDGSFFMMGDDSGIKQPAKILRRSWLNSEDDS